jgi:hypothetical protein
LAWTNKQTNKQTLTILTSLQPFLSEKGLMVDDLLAAGKAQTFSKIQNESSCGCQILILL